MGKHTEGVAVLLAVMTLVVTTHLPLLLAGHASQPLARDGFRHLMQTYNGQLKSDNFIIWLVSARTVGPLRSAGLYVKMSSLCPSE